VLVPGHAAGGQRVGVDGGPVVVTADDDLEIEGVVVGVEIGDFGVAGGVVDLDDLEGDDRRRRTNRRRERQQWR
jgi:hypothetical protein